MTFSSGRDKDSVLDTRHSRRTVLSKAATLTMGFGAAILGAGIPFEARRAMAANCGCCCQVSTYSGCGATQYSCEEFPNPPQLIYERQYYTSCWASCYSGDCINPSCVGPWSVYVCGECPSPNTPCYKGNWPGLDPCAHC